MMGGPDRLPDFLGGTDPACQIGHVNPPADEWVRISAGSTVDSTVRVQLDDEEENEVTQRKVVISFRTEDYPAVRVQSAVVLFGAITNL
eukprot:SAG31_NODE_6306_length_2073_cov_1.774569_2_plen_89_part_00